MGGYCLMAAFGKKPANARIHGTLHADTHLAWRRRSAMSATNVRPNPFPRGDSFMKLHLHAWLLTSLVAVIAVGCEPRPVVNDRDTGSTTTTAVTEKNETSVDTTTPNGTTTQPGTSSDTGAGAGTDANRATPGSTTSGSSTDSGQNANPNSTQ
jgi:hypothetical protein